MPRLRTAACAAAGIVLLAGCGEPSGPAAARNDPGTGSQTLQVTADIEGKDQLGGFVTDMDVSLRDAQGNPVSGATVTVRNGAIGTITLVETGAASGDYSASVNSFPSGDYRLDVVSGVDGVSGVVVGGIAAHVITSPARGDTVAAGQPLAVTWNRPSEAASAEVESREHEAQNLVDVGTHTIPAADVRARADERVRVWRVNEVLMAGALGGSRLKLKVRNTVEPVIVR